MLADKEKCLATVRALIETGKHADARSLLLESLKEEADDRAILLILGGSYFNCGKYVEAELIFERLILLYPGEGQFSVALFNTLWRLSRAEEAIDELRRFISVADKVKEKDILEQYIELTHLLTDDFEQFVS